MSGVDGAAGTAIPTPSTASGYGSTGSRRKTPTTSKPTKPKFNLAKERKASTTLGKFGINNILVFLRINPLTFVNKSDFLQFEL